MNLNEKWVGEEMRGVEVGEIIFRLCFLRKESMFNKRGKRKVPNTSAGSWTNDFSGVTCRSMVDWKSDCNFYFIILKQIFNNNKIYHVERKIWSVAHVISFYLFKV